MDPKLYSEYGSRSLKFLKTDPQHCFEVKQTPFLPEEELLHLAAASDEHHLGAAEHLLVNLQHVQLRHPKQWLNQSTPNNGSTNQP